MICGYEDMPCTVRGFVRETCEPDGDYYTIVLNSRLSYEESCGTFIHERAHIYNKDFNKERSVDSIEIDTHK